MRRKWALAKNLPFSLSWRQKKRWACATFKKNIHPPIFPSGLIIIGMDTYGNICWKFPRNSSMETSISTQNSIESRNKYKYQSSLELLLVALISSKCSDPYISISPQKKFLRTALRESHWLECSFSLVV